MKKDKNVVRNDLCGEKQVFQMNTHFCVCKLEPSAQ